MEDSKVYRKASNILQLSTPSALTLASNYNDNYRRLYFFLFKVWED